MDSLSPNIIPLDLLLLKKKLPNEILRYIAKLLYETYCKDLIEHIGPLIDTYFPRPKYTSFCFQYPPREIVLNKQNKVRLQLLEKSKYIRELAISFKNTKTIEEDQFDINSWNRGEGLVEIFHEIFKANPDGLRSLIIGPYNTFLDIDILLRLLSAQPQLVNLSFNYTWGNSLYDIESFGKLRPRMVNLCTLELLAIRLNDVQPVMDLVTSLLAKGGSLKHLSLGANVSWGEGEEQDEKFCAQSHWLFLGEHCSLETFKLFSWIIYDRDIETFIDKLSAYPRLTTLALLHMLYIITANNMDTVDIEVRMFKYLGRSPLTKTISTLYLGSKAASMSSLVFDYASDIIRGSQWLKVESLWLSFAPDDGGEVETDELRFLISFIFPNLQNLSLGMRPLYRCYSLRLNSDFRRRRGDWTNIIEHAMEDDIWEWIVKQFPNLKALSIGVNFYKLGYTKFRTIVKDVLPNLTHLHIRNRYITNTQSNCRSPPEIIMREIARSRPGIIIGIGLKDFQLYALDADNELQVSGSVRKTEHLVQLRPEIMIDRASPQMEIFAMNDLAYLKLENYSPFAFCSKLLK